jgi:hypothetical protein
MSLAIRRQIRCIRRRRVRFETRDIALHLCNFAYLRVDYAIGELPHGGVFDMGPLACHDCNRMMRDHRAHVRHVSDCLLTSDKPKGDCEDGNAPRDNRPLPVKIGKKRPRLHRPAGTSSSKAF